MAWNIAQAKQQFSEVVRLCAQEPQGIDNRDKAVPTLVNADQFAAFEAWRASQVIPPLLAQFREVGQALIKEGFELRAPLSFKPLP